MVIPLASDPFGRGWDVFGTAHYKIAVGVVGARFAWYTSGPRTGRRSQYPLAALMVAYTMLSLWILAQPIIESAK